jgi:recombination protein RecA
MTQLTATKQVPTTKESATAGPRLGSVEREGERNAMAEKVGSERVGAEKAGAERAGAEKATADKQTPAERDKQRNLAAALADIEKSYGKGAIMRLGDRGQIAEVRGIYTGALSLDLALGGKGLPRGRIVEIFGPESSGKTTLTLQVIANCQKEGGVCAFVDAEHALDPAYARRLGVSLDDLLVSQPDTGEQALEIVETLVRSNAVDVVVIDSVAALVPRAEIEGEMGDSFVGLQARLMSQALRKLTAAIARSECLVIFINQIREKIGVMFGSPETTTGGRALKFYSSVRLDIRRIGQIKEGEEVVGSRCKVTVVKNKVAPPFRKVEFDIMFDRGISYEGDLLDLGLLHGIVLKSGTWLSFKHPKDGEIRLGQGREKARALLIDNPALAKDLDAQLRTRLATKEGASALPSSASASDDDETRGAGLVVSPAGLKAIGKPSKT